MTDTPELILVGRLGRAHGIHGEINLYPSIDEESMFSLAEDKDFFLHLEIDGLPVPFLVEDIRGKAESSLLVKFEEVDSREEAERYDGCSVYVPADLIGEDIEFQPHHFIGYTLVDANEVPVGKVIDIDDNTANILLIVERKDSNEEVMIPIADELVHYIDVEKQLISLTIPDGMI